MKDGNRHCLEPSEDGLHVCPKCESQVVQLVHLEEADDIHHFRLWLRCPECEWRGGGVHDEAEIDCLEQVIEGGVRAIERAFIIEKRLNMELLAELFRLALEADLITPDDFAS